MDKQVNVVMSSMDYDKFSFLTGNRPVDIQKRQPLLKSIEDYPLERPIDVNEKFQIIDGQNRFECWRSLKMPIIFIIHTGWGETEIPVLNSNQKNWLPSDYSRSYAELGNANYKTYREFDDSYGLPHQVNMLLLSGGLEKHNRHEKFTSGLFKVTSLHWAQETARKLRDFKPYFDNYKNLKFSMAFVRLVKMKDYDHAIMMKKSALHSDKFFHCTSTDAYALMLKKIYNNSCRGGYKMLD